MNSIAVVVLALVGFTNAGIVAPVAVAQAPLGYVHGHGHAVYHGYGLPYQVAPAPVVTKVAHPIAYAAPVAVPVVKTHAVAYTAPLVAKSAVIAPAPIAYAAGPYHHPVAAVKAVPAVAPLAYSAYPAFHAGVHYL